LLNDLAEAMKALDGKKTQLGLTKTAYEYVIYQLFAQLVDGMRSRHTRRGLQQCGKSSDATLKEKCCCKLVTLT